MGIFRRFSPNFSSGMLAAVMLSIWLAFAPIQAGGLASYIIVVGNSMEPNFHIGDLVIVHKEAAYQIGDAVVYHNLELENFVFHRIIQQELGRFSLQGDNNSWIDNYRPDPSEILGKLWLHIPKGGIFMQKIRDPYVMAGIAALLGVFLMLGSFTEKGKEKKRMNSQWFSSLTQRVRQRFSGTGRPASSGPDNGNLLETLFFILGLLAFGSLLLGIISFSRPASRTLQDDISYDQLGVFAYTTTAPQGVYDSNLLQSGDPIFPKLTCAIDITFQYTFIASQPAEVKGTYRLTADIAEDTSNWKRSLPLQDETSFTGNAFGTTAKLDLCKLEKLAQTMEENTDFHPGSYTLTVSPHIKLDGELDGRALQDEFNPGLVFKYDRIHFYLLQDEETGSSLSTLESRALSGKRIGPNTVQAFGREISIPALRWISILLLLFSGGCLAWIGLRYQNLERHDPIGYIRTRYGGSLIDIQNSEQLSGSVMVDVSTIDDLHRLADQHDVMILHSRMDSAHVFHVRTDGPTYRFILDLKTGTGDPEQGSS